jgi:hypothetical protein
MAKTDTTPPPAATDAEPAVTPPENSPEPPTPFAQKSEDNQPFAAADSPADVDAENPQTISWTASEFIAHDKTFGWYVGLAVVALILAAGIHLITKDLVAPAVVIVAAAFLGYFGSHKPRELEYRLDQKGVSIGERQFSYNAFRSFSVIPEGAFSSIVFMPLKRFALPLTLYYAPRDETNIVNILSNQLPLEERRPDAIDRLMRRIRF